MKSNTQKKVFRYFRKKIDKYSFLKQKYKGDIKKYNTIDNKLKNILLEKSNHLLELYQPEQRSPEWYKMRETMFTASTDVSGILGISEYNNNLNKVVRKKCGDEDNKFNGNKYTWHGQKYEEIASLIYSHRYDKVVREYGLIQHPFIECLGASPDGITTDCIMVEIKCPSGRKINGTPKTGYYIQMQVQMEVCDLDTCMFVECDIKQYDDYDDYKFDEYDKDDIEYLDIIPRTNDLSHIKVPNCRRTKKGLEKGLIGVYNFENSKDPGELKFIYPDFNYTTDQQKIFLEKEKQKFIENNKKFEIHYWYLDFSSIIEVKRDKELWKKMDITNKLRNAWKMVEYARKNGTDHLKTKKNTNKKTKTKNKDNDNTIKLDMLHLESEMDTDDNVIDMIENEEQIILNDFFLDSQEDNNSDSPEDKEQIQFNDFLLDNSEDCILEEKVIYTSKKKN